MNIVEKYPFSGDDIDNYRDASWRDALQVALATHPRQELRAIIGPMNVEDVENMLATIPDGMLRLVRKCLDCLFSPGDYDASLAPVMEKIRGGNPAFDALLAKLSSPTGVTLH